MYQNWVGLAWAENVFISFYILWCFAYLFLCIFLVSSCWIWADRRIPHARDESVATRPVLPLFMRRISIAGSIFHSFLTSHSIQAVRILEIRCQVGWSDFIDIFSQVTCLKKKCNGVSTLAFWQKLGDTPKSHMSSGRKKLLIDDWMGFYYSAPERFMLIYSYNVIAHCGMRELNHLGSWLYRWECDFMFFSVSPTVSDSCCWTNALKSYEIVSTFLFIDSSLISPIQYVWHCLTTQKMGVLLIESRGTCGTSRMNFNCRSWAHPPCACGSTMGEAKSSRPVRRRSCWERHGCHHISDGARNRVELF